MPKKKKTEPDEMAAFMGAGLAAAQKAFGRVGAYVAAEHATRRVGIPIPNFPLSWLTHSAVWPLQALTLSGGPPQSCKSALLFELHRWFLNAGGAVVHVETENKMSSELMQSIIDPVFFSDRAYLYQVIAVQQVEEWQAELSRRMRLVEDFLLKQEYKPKFPLLLSVDSMMGPPTEEGGKYIETNLAAKGRQFSDAPLVISEYLKKMSSRVLGFPVCVHMTNHEKEKIDAAPAGKFAAKQMRRSGGSAPDFHAGLDLSHVRVGKADVFSSYGEGHDIRLTVRKNSFGPGMRRITVPFLWRWELDEQTGKKKQRSWWDWDIALIRFLTDGNKQKVSNVLDISAERVGGMGLMAWSSTFGIEKKNAIPANEMGRLIHENEELLRGLREVFSIPESVHFEAGCMDYPDDVARLKARRKALTQKKASIGAKAKAAEEGEDDEGSD